MLVHNTIIVVHKGIALLCSCRDSCSSSKDRYAVTVACAPELQKDQQKKVILASRCEQLLLLLGLFSCLC